MDKVLDSWDWLFSFVILFFSLSILVGVIGEGHGDMGLFSLLLVTLELVKLYVA